MNSNNWLSFPHSPSHSSLPTHLQPSHSTHQHQFSLGLVSEYSLDNPFHSQDWNLINSQHHHHGGSEGGEVPKVADFLGVSKTEDTQSDLAAFHDDDSTGYLFPSANGTTSHHLLLQQHQNYMGAEAAAATPPDDNNINYHDLLPRASENASALQSLTLCMGSAGGNGKGVATSCDSTGIGVVSSATGTADAVPKRTLDTFGQRTSIYRGVTRHRWTGRYEAHLWDNSCRREGQSRKGRQVYLGGYDKEEKAARAYDMAALKYWGTSTTTNFPISHYEKELEDMKHMTRQEFVASIRRKSSGFSRGASMYRGVTRHHQHGRWQARIGRVAGNKDLYLGTFSTEEEAAEAYDIAAIKFRGLNAVTNFDMNRYDVKSILESNTLPIGGGAARRLKEAHAMESTRKCDELIALGRSSPSSCFQYGSSSSAASPRLHPYAIPLTDHQQQQLQQSHHQQPLLALQNPEITYQDPVTQLQLHQHHTSASFLNPYNNPFYSSSSYALQSDNNPALIHGLMSLDGSSSGDGGSAVGGYFGTGIMGYGTTTLPPVGNVTEEELALVKVDYDMRASARSTYGGGWPGDSSTNPAGFTMWND